MARDFDSVVAEVAGRTRKDIRVAAELALVEGWLNDTIQDVHSRDDWYWACDRKLVQTVPDATTGTVSISNGASTVTGSSTVFSSGDVGKFIQFEGANDWYKITAVASATSLTIEAPLAASTVADGTYIIRKMFYTIPGAEKVVSIKQNRDPRKVVCIDHKDFDTYLTFSDDTGAAQLFCVYGVDSTGTLQFNIHPHADEAFNLEVKYKKPAVQDSLDIIPDKWRHVYLDGALMRGYEYVALGTPDFNRAAITEKKADFERGVARMVASAKPESDSMPVLRNNDVPNLPVGDHLRLGLSIPQD